MNFEPQPKSEATPERLEFAFPPARESLDLLQDADRALSGLDVTSAPAVSGADFGAGETPALEECIAAETPALRERVLAFLSELAKIDRGAIGDEELQPARIQVGLTFIGFGGLAMVLLLVYIGSLHPELSWMERVREYWYQYIWFVCLGVAGMMMVGRESIRPPVRRRDEQV
ncbi:hypothetical protein [Kamptonema formosum]|uniref:hypothetical protein n=1 Tax=Kamptonema formosum TaxID=331992 RepID=UPI0003477D36|nr:hypothetical protein [Oscillatoria sp. PCC 10802]